MPVLLPVHIAAAAVSLGAGTIALVARKGSRVHRRSGLMFVGAMLAMCASAVILAVAKGQTVNAVAGTLTAYLVITALTTVRPAAAASRAVDVALMAVAGVLGLTTLTFAIEALSSPSGRSHGYPPYPFFMFAALGLFGSVGDLRVINRGSLRGAPRLARHLWRMCSAFLITTLSFFTVRSRVAMLIPASLVTTAVQFIPVLLVALSMFYWLWRVRVRAHYRFVTPSQ